ncbi:hypothetical protein D9756_002002 [Leucocoprinus leucothites]|uniref:Uncharacterized protein n=1 Tax=Leucocoprinus leucothites TaxID=201217 RepID=A0A8H5LMB3_9AGAR|nr:hypothetical protein D9756_002002 [Leucoagaricus leucothites]
MLSIQVSRILIFALTFLPSLIPAKRDGGGGGGRLLGTEYSKFSLKLFDAAEFAFSVIFAIVTALQAFKALSNIRRRINKVPPSIAALEYSVGPIFPTCLLMATLLLTTAYVLHATYVGLVFNTSQFSGSWWSVSFIGAWYTIEFFADIFLVSSILALLLCRMKIMLGTPRRIMDVKAIADAILVVILLALSVEMGFRLCLDLAPEHPSPTIYLTSVLLS